MQEQEATTPSRRIYFSIYNVLDQDNVKNYRDTFMSYVEDFMDATTFSEVRRTCSIVEDVNSGNYYRAMKTCKVLMNEDEMLKVGKKAAQLEVTDVGD